MGRTRDQLHQEHLARLAAWAAKAKPDPGINLVNRQPIPPLTTRAEPLNLPPLSDMVSAHYAPGWDCPFNINGAVHAPEITVDLIILAVCHHYAISRRQLMRPRRTVDIVRPRQIALYLAAQYTICSLPYIGKRFGGMDHTTVMHANERIAEFIKSDPAVARDVAQLKRVLGVA